MLLLGATLPFPLVGVPLNEYFVLSLTSVVGLIFGLRRLARLGWQPLHKSAAAMLLVFAATAALRYPVTSYVLSLGALGLAMLPLTTPLTNDTEIRALMRGLMTGLWLTLAFVLIAILIQVGGFQTSLGPVALLFVRSDQTGVFLGYVRPTGGFSEPSHLAIYLASFYVVLDLLARAGRSSGYSRLFIALAIVFTGSVSGLVLFITYLGVKLLASLHTLLIGGLSRTGMVRGVAAVCVLLVATAYLGSNRLDTDEYVLRLIQALEDIETGNLVGSEGSRVNAVLALPGYWESAGLPGFLMGTGYANYHEWLLDNYGHLNVSATFSRGEVDSILIVVFLSTGVVGFVAYLAFLYKAFGHRVVMANMPLVVFVLTINFSYGYLISGLYWSLLFVLASVARSTWGARRTRHSGRAHVRRRQQAVVRA